jgi:hypothetical protein
MAGTRRSILLLLCLWPIAAQSAARGDDSVELQVVSDGDELGFVPDQSPVLLERGYACIFGLPGESAANHTTGCCFGPDVWTLSSPMRTDKPATTSFRGGTMSGLLQRPLYAPRAKA